MPLQIRRGTQAERGAMTVPLATGELLYVTDDQRLYIGNGTTLGGVQISGYTDADAKDAAAAIFAGGTHSGITFTYDTIANIIDATVDLSSYNGAITATVFKGTLTADDSTILIDAVDGKINLDGTVKGNIIPDSNETYDLGSASYRFRDLYLSGTSIKLGSATITSTGSAVNLPAGSTIGGVPITAPTDTSLVADIQGSVFGDDSTILVDAITGSLSTGTLLISGDVLKSTSGFFYVGDEDDQAILIINGPSGTPSQMQVSAPLNGAAGLTQFGPGMRLSSFNGTYSSPTVLATGDLFGQINFQGKINAGGFGELTVDAVSIRAVVEDGGDLVSNIAEGKLQFAFVHGPNPLDTVVVEISSYGNLSAPSIQPGVYANATARDAYITSPSPGMLVYLTATSKFSGYVDDAGSGSPGWVDLN